MIRVICIFMLVSTLFAKNPFTDTISVSDVKELICFLPDYRDEYVQGDNVDVYAKVLTRFCQVNTQLVEPIDSVPIGEPSEIYNNQKHSYTFALPSDSVLKLSIVIVDSLYFTMGVALPGGQLDSVISTWVIKVMPTTPIQKKQVFKDMVISVPLIYYDVLGRKISKTRNGIYFNKNKKIIILSK